MKIMLTCFNLKRRILVILFTFASVALFAQAVPEYMYYKFNAAGNQTNFASAPVGLNPAPLIGLTIGGAGQFGTALVGNGGLTDNNYLNTGWAPNFGAANWTISMWLNGVSNAGSGSPFYLFGDVNSGSWRCFAEGAAGAGSLLLRGGGLNDVLVTGVAPGPMVVTFVHTVTGLRVFKNGVFINEVAQGVLSCTGAGPFKVGGYSTGVTGMNAGCLMDEFRMYNRALSDAEVALTWNQQLPLGGGSITGTVRNYYTLLPISGATVTVQGGGPTTTTALDGTYTLVNVSPGAHNVQCSAGGYVTQTKPVTVILNQTVTCNFYLEPVTANISGVVTNASTLALLIGAKVWVTPTPTLFTYSILNGSYLLKIYPTGTYTLHCKKWGFQQWDGTPTLYTVNNNYTQNIPLNEELNAPGSMTAALNGSQTAVNLNWTLPWGYYLRVFDDGVEENFTIWAAEGNMNAVKFSPLTVPYRVHGCQIDIGTSLDYTGNPFVPFQVALYDASGPGGKPGAVIAGPYDVTPTVYGWNEFIFPADAVIASGDFYVVQIQGGAAPDAAGCAIDTSTQQVRSYQRFVTGGGPWLLASGNFMMRAIMLGSGGPLLTPNKPAMLAGGGAIEGAIYANKPGTVYGTEGSGPDAPESIINYQYWRLHQGEEATPGVWNSVGVTTGFSGVDNTWPSLPDGAYRWAVKAQYTGAFWSPPTFSNVIGKNWTAAVTVNVTLSCDSASINNTVVTLVNVPFDSTYTGTLSGPGNTGSISFPHVWKGNYNLIVTKWGYTLYSQAVSVMSPSTFDVFLLQWKTPPTGLHVDEHSLEATWFPPNSEQLIFNETWASGTFATNNWTPEGANWFVTGGFGNPSPSAEFYYLPEQTGYTLPLTSKVISGVHSPKLYLKWDIYLDNFGTTALNSMTVELWNGVAWTALKNYDNTASIPWTTGVADISSVTNSDFQFRFNAHGDDCYYINGWYIDNVQVIAADVPGKNPCILGYNFYLNSVLTAVVPDTFYYIPPAMVVYGQTYTACVAAVYGSGYSTTTCFTFTSHFLCPPTDLTAVTYPNEDVAYLTWVKPACMGGTMLDICYDDGTEETGWGINPGYVDWLGNYFPIDPSISGDLKSFDLYFFLNAGGTYSVTIDVFTPGGVLLGSSDPFVIPTDAWINVVVPDISVTGPFYGMVKYNNLSGLANWFGEDTDGPNASMNLAYYYDGAAFATLSSFGYAAGVFLECAHLLAYGDKKEMVLTPGHINNVPPTVTAAPASLAMIATASTPAPHVTPLVPSASDGQIGYNIYRDGNFLAYVNGPNTLEYYDLGLDPGNYCYTVTAKYDLTVYGFPGQFGESLESNESCVSINYGYELPFYEPWDQGTFDFQNWTFGLSGQGNWSMNTAVGNPVPSADFSWQPMITNYDFSLVSPSINASGWTCADIWLDFDVKLVDRNATSAELLDVEVYYSNNWFTKLELVNNGSFDWTTQHLDISGVAGKAFKIRFRANGANSADILHWYVDNIHAYGICHPPTALAGLQTSFTTTLSWTAPECSSGGGGTIMQFIFDDGTWENGWRINPGFQVTMGNQFPIASTLVGVLQSFDLYFVDNGTGSSQTLSIQVYDGTQTLVGETGTFTAAPFDEWITVVAPDIPFNGMFYAMVYWNNVPGNSYYLGDDEDGPYSPDNLYYMYDFATWTHPAATPAVFLLRATALVGADLKMVELTPTSMRPVAGVNTNSELLSSSNTKGDSKDHSIMGVTGSGLDSTTVVGYSMYRTQDDAGLGPFVELGSVTSLTYADVHPNTTEPGSQWYYFVTAVMQRSYDNHFICEPASDTILIQFPAVGVNNLGNNTINLYPNPANDLVNVVSTTDIKTVEVLNYIGQLVYTNKSVNSKMTQLNVSTLQAGVYFVKVTTADGLKTVKITVTH